jgi:hypothetical protein
VRRLSMLLAGAVLLLAGCGGGGGSDKPASDEDQVKAAITGAYSAFAKGDADGFCNKLSADYRKDFDDYYGECNADTINGIVAKLPEEGRKALESPQIGAAKISGDEAYPEVNGDGLEMVKEGGEWKLDDFDLPGS